MGSHFSNSVTEADLQPGDHLYVWSSIFHHHHGIYVGNDTVIHVYGQRKLESRIQSTTVSEFRRGRILKRARYDVPSWHLCWKAAGTAYDFPADPPALIVSRAIGALVSGTTEVQPTRVRGVRTGATEATQNKKQGNGTEPEAGTSTTGERKANAPANPSPASSSTEETPRPVQDLEPPEASVPETPSTDTGSTEQSSPPEPKFMTNIRQFLWRRQKVKAANFVPPNWTYNILVRNCETFCLQCTAPGRSECFLRSHQAKMLVFNPISTVICGMRNRMGYYTGLAPEDTTKPPTLRGRLRRWIPRR